MEGTLLRNRIMKAGEMDVDQSVWRENSAIVRDYQRSTQEHEQSLQPTNQQAEIPVGPNSIAALAVESAQLPEGVTDLSQYRETHRESEQDRALRIERAQARAAEESTSATNAMQFLEVYPRQVSNQSASSSVIDTTLDSIGFVPQNPERLIDAA